MAFQPCPLLSFPSVCLAPSLSPTPSPPVSFSAVPRPLPLLLSLPSHPLVCPSHLPLSFSFQLPIYLLLSPLGFLLPLRSSGLLPALRVCLSLGFFLCPFVCSLRASFSVRPSLYPPPPPTPFSLGQSFSPAPLLSLSALGLLPPARPSPLGERPSGSGVPSPSRLRSERRAGAPLRRSSRFLSSSRPLTPSPGGPSPSRPCCGPAGLPESPGRPASGRGRPASAPEVTLQRGGAGSGAARAAAPSTARGGGPPGTPPPPAPAARPLGAYLGARCPPPAARARPGRAAHTSASARPPRPWSLRAWPGRPGVRACGARGPLRPAARRALLAAGSSATARAPSHRAGAADELTAVRSLARGCRGRGSVRGRPMGAGRRPAGGGAGAGVGGAPSPRGGRQVVGWAPGPAPLAAGCTVSSGLGLAQRLLPSPARPPTP